MDLEDEEAPPLIDLTDGSAQNLTGSSPVVPLQELSLSKVPLTIVTGELLFQNTTLVYM